MAVVASKEFRKAARDREEAARVAEAEQARADDERLRREAEEAQALSPWERFVLGYDEAATFLKLYLTAPLPLEFSDDVEIFKIKNPAEVDDPEAYIRAHFDPAKYGLEGGPLRFKWALWQNNRRLAEYPVALLFPRGAAPAAGPTAGPMAEAAAKVVDKAVDRLVSEGKGGVADMLKEAGPLIVALKELFGGGQKTADALLTKLLDRDKSDLLEMAKAVAPIVAALKDLGLVGRTSPLEAALAKTLEQRVGDLVGGGSPDAKGRMAEIREWIELLSSFGLAGGPAPRSSLEILAEKAPEIAERFAGPMEKVADAWIIRQGVIPPGYTVAPTATGRAPTATVTPTPIQPSPDVAQLSEEITREAARLNDAYFPRLLDKLSPMFAGRGREFLAAIQQGQVAEAEAFETFQGVGFPLTPPIRGYLRRFMHWLRAGARPQPAPAAPPAPPAPPEDNGRPPVPPPGSVVGRCAGCGVEYLFETEAIWEAEKDDPCARCRGRIGRVVVEEPAP